MSESLPKQRKFQVTIPDLTWEEAVEMVEAAAGGSTLFCDQDGKAFNPSCAPYPVVYAYPRDKQASLALMGYDQSRCAELEAENAALREREKELENKIEWQDATDYARQRTEQVLWRVLKGHGLTDAAAKALLEDCPPAPHQPAQSEGE